MFSKYLKNIKLVVFVLTIIVLAIIGVVVMSDQYLHKSSGSSPSQNSDNIVKLSADMLGTGKPQELRIQQGEEGVIFSLYAEDKLVTQRVYDDGTIRAADDYSLVKFDASSPTDYLVWKQMAGPHQSELFVLMVIQGNFYSIPSGDFTKKVWYEPFWNNRDDFFINDLEGDGLLEIFEYTDEYPPDAPRLSNPELEQITSDAFAKYNIEEATDSMIEILNRENNGEGRGRKVLWAIHTFEPGDPPLFRKLIGVEFSDQADRLLGAYSMVRNNVSPEQSLQEIISKDQLSQDSIDFNLFVRSFWTSGMPYETEMKLK